MAGVEGSNSRKKGHLEAGKRRLEEFRKKKAEAKAKKSASGAQVESDVVGQVDNLLQEEEERDIGSAVLVKDLEPLPPSDFGTSSLLQDTVIGTIDNNIAGLSNIYDDSKHISSYANHGGSMNTKQPSDSKEGTITERLENGYYDRYEDVSIREVIKNTVEDTREALDAGENRLSGLYSVHSLQLEENGNSSSGYQRQDYGFSSRLSAGSHETYSDGTLHFGADNSSQVVDKATTTSYRDMLSLTSSSPDDALMVGGQYAGREAKRNHGSGWLSGASEKRYSGDIGYQSNLETAPWRNSRSSFFGSNVNTGSSSTQGSIVSSEIEARPSLPSFVNSVSVSSASSPFGLYHGPEKSSRVADFENSRLYKEDFSSLTSAEPFPDNLNGEEILMNTFASIRENNVPLKHDNPLSNKDETFATLEQHIEDLTQEKFALQRALESSRTLTESLAAENSSLTDSFNQQGAVVNQLKLHMETLQEDIKSQLAEIQALKMEYANAQLECNAADERAKILATELIGLEEKALRLRSNELKLEREMENASTEVGSYKRKVTILEKERSELIVTVDALREEKKLLHYKIQNASSEQSFVDKRKSFTVTKDVSTSTVDLDVEVSNDMSNNLDPSFLPANDAGSSSVLSSSINGGPLMVESADPYYADTSSSIPDDQLRTINNIDFLLSELSLEKEELLRALTLESSKCSEFKALNKELSKKLEAQTQRLELLTAQNMASSSIQMKSTDFNSLRDDTLYPDEGDEVVERVLGWIMRLFPGGPAKRRTSKLL